EAIDPPPDGRCTCGGRLMEGVRFMALPPPLPPPPARMPPPPIWPPPGRPPPPPPPPARPPPPMPPRARMSPWVQSKITAAANNTDQNGRAFLTDQDGPAEWWIRFIVSPLYSSQEC